MAKEKFGKTSKVLNNIMTKIVDKACFEHDMVYRDFKDLNRRTAADKVLHDKTFNIAKNLKYD